ncbi:putative chromo domain-containing protein [Colletotrichum sublineola]|uniref:Putative chromo domain-containing protein n=1 Tax=Colletotrichum sublineola TaxID=1173701 RepID=A0A066XVW7_COLSU|nr:putative chromo domain-containing protein [Colletotrichum sublineola]
MNGTNARSAFFRIHGQSRTLAGALQDASPEHPISVTPPQQIRIPTAAMKPKSPKHKSPKPRSPYREPAPKVQVIHPSQVSKEIPLVVGMYIDGHGRMPDGETVLKLTRQSSNLEEAPFLAWVPEHTLQYLDAEAVYEYWEELSGGRDYQLGFVHKWNANIAAGRNKQEGIKWEIFKISESRIRNREIELLVHWQGYREAESTWIAEQDLKRQAPKAVSYFWEVQNDPTAVVSKQWTQTSLSQE